MLTQRTRKVCAFRYQHSGRSYEHRTWKSGYTHQCSKNAKLGGLLSRVRMSAKFEKGCLFFIIIIIIIF